MWLGVLLVSLPRAYCKKTKVGELAVGKDTSKHLGTVRTSLVLD